MKLQYIVPNGKRLCQTPLMIQILHQACNAARAGDAVGLLRLYVGALRMAPYLMVRIESLAELHRIGLIIRCTDSFM